MNGFKVLKSQIANELEKMKRLLDEAAEIEGKKASNMTIRTGGSIVHDFYTGAGNIFHAIASSIDESVPSGMSWHTELLNQMTLNIEGLRSPIISKDTAKLLDEYLRFRHLFRKRYGFDLEWTNIKKLLKKMTTVYKSMESDLNKAFEDKE
jgi:acyl-[acyl carrier protein]--UDP-N-acetylglucosamine O-acyltransferase